MKKAVEPNNCEIVDSGFNGITLGWNKNNFKTYVLNPDGPKIRIGSFSEDKDIKKYSLKSNIIQFLYLVFYHNHSS